MSSILIQAWTVYKSGDGYYLRYTDWVYLKEIVKYYDDICLLSPTILIQKDNLNQFMAIEVFTDVTVHPLYRTNNHTYIGAIKHFPEYFKAYRLLRDFDIAYARYPAPFGWLQKVFMNKSKRIVHFVGRPVDTVLKNPNIKTIKKIFLVLFFLPEHLIYLWACKGAKVYTNGVHIHNNLAKAGIKSESLVSSTLHKDDFYYDTLKNISNKRPRLLYLGYLRKAKGVDTIIKSFGLLQNKIPGAELTIIGDGDSKQDLHEMVNQNSIKNVHFLGHIDDRARINHIMRNHDIFCFASLSEGSPRVVIESMANGLNVVSTPVGSLPHVFVNNKDIVYFDFNNHEMLFEKIIFLINNDNDASLIRESAFCKIKKYTIKNFLKKIFYNV
jgi:glycosyltransferase involved in cell wall biosynthesis